MLRRERKIVAAKVKAERTTIASLQGSTMKAQPTPRATHALLFPSRVTDQMDLPALGSKKNLTLFWKTLIDADGFWRQNVSWHSSSDMTQNQW